MTSAAYCVLLVCLWLARPWSTSPLGRSLFFVALAGALAAIILRVHLWFTFRSFPDEWAGQRLRAGRWIRLGDITLGTASLVAGIVYSTEQPMAAALFVASAVAIAVAFALIEPATTQAAMRQIGR